MRFSGTEHRHVALIKLLCRMMPEFIPLNVFTSKQPIPLPSWLPDMKTKPSLSSAPEVVTPVSVIQCEYRLARPLQALACPIAHTSWLLCQKNIEQMTIRRVCNSKLTVLTKQLNMASDLNVLVHAAFKQFRLITGFQSALLGFRRQWWWPSNKHTDKLMRYELTGNCNGFRVPSAKQMQTEYTNRQQFTCLNCASCDLILPDKLKGKDKGKGSRFILRLYWSTLHSRRSGTDHIPANYTVPASTS